MFTACSARQGATGQVDILPDSALTASSTHSASLAPTYSRLNDLTGGGSWSSGALAVGQYIQLDLQEVKVVVKVATQSRRDSGQFVTAYKLSTSYGGSYTFVLNDLDASEKLFAANVDSNSIVEHCLDNIQAQFVRLYPQTWHSHMSLRWNVYVIEYGKPRCKT